MLARTGRIPTGRGWVFEAKVVGFRCLLCNSSVEPDQIKPSYRESRSSDDRGVGRATVLPEDGS
jgi:hypothetical protein